MHGRPHMNARILLFNLKFFEFEKCSDDPFIKGIMMGRLWYFVVLASRKPVWPSVPARQLPALPVGRWYKRPWIRLPIDARTADATHRHGGRRTSSKKEETSVLLDRLLLPSANTQQHLWRSIEQVKSEGTWLDRSLVRLPAGRRRAHGDTTEDLLWSRRAIYAKATSSSPAYFHMHDVQYSTLP